jgi:hypothetical protein
VGRLLFFVGQSPPKHTEPLSTGTLRFPLAFELLRRGITGVRRRNLRVGFVLEEVSEVSALASLSARAKRKSRLDKSSVSEHINMGYSRTCLSHVSRSFTHPSGTAGLVEVNGVVGSGFWVVQFGSRNEIMAENARSHQHRTVVNMQEIKDLSTQRCQARSFTSYI